MPVSIRPKVKSPEEKFSEEQHEVAASAEVREGLVKENLVVVEVEGAINEEILHPRTRLTLNHLLRMNKHEVLAVGQDRGYWRSTGRLTHKSESEVRELFAKAQDTDRTGLHDPLGGGGATVEEQAAEAQGGDSGPLVQSPRPEK